MVPSPASGLLPRPRSMESLIVEGSNQVKMPPSGGSRFHGLEDEAASRVEARNGARGNPTGSSSKNAETSKQKPKVKGNMSPFLQSIMSRPRSNTTGTTPKTPGNSSPQASRIGAKHTSLTRRRESHDVADLRSPDNVGEKHLLFPFGTRHNDTHVETSMEAGPSYSLGMPSRSTAGRPPESNRRQTARRSTGRLPPLGSSKDTALSDNDVHDVPDSDDEHQVTSNLRRSPRKSVATLSRVDDKRVTTTSPTRGLGIGKGSSSSSAKKPQANPTYEVDDEPESITQFPSSPHGSPGRRKTEQRETRLPTASPQPTRLQPVVKRKDLMQRRDGSIPQREHVTLKPSKPPLQSSNLSRPTIFASIEVSFVDDSAERLVANTFKMMPNSQEFSLHTDGKNAPIPFSSINELEIYGDEAPTVRLDLSLQESKRNLLANLRAENKEAAFKGSTLFILFRDEQGPRDALKELSLRLGKRKVFKTPTCERGTFLDLLKAARSKASSKAAPARTIREQTLLAAERRQMPPRVQRDTSINDRRTANKDKGKAAEDDKQPKLSFTNDSGRRRSSRLKGREASSAFYAEYADDPITPVNRPIRKDKDVVLFPYPPEGRTELTMTKGEKYRIEDQDFLNDVALEFGLRYTLDTRCDSQLRSSVYLFSSYFYDKLSRKDKQSKPTGELWPAYDAVKKWTKSVDIFKKKYIIVPINESFHWRAQTEMSRRATTSISPADGNAAASDSGGAQERMSSTLVEGDESRDELDIITDMEEGAVAQGVGMIGDSMDRMSIDGDKPQASPPRPIVSATYEAFVDQLSLRSRSQSGSPSKGASGRKVCKEVDIVNSDSTYVITFDSLGGVHRAVSHDLERWLHFEARDKLKIELDSDLDKVQYLEAKVPTQPNFSDCGVYLIHYIDCLLSNQVETLNFIGQPMPSPRNGTERELWQKRLQRVWKASNMTKLRAHWVSIIDEQTAKWNSLQDSAPNKAHASLTEDSQSSVVLATQQAMEDKKLLRAPNGLSDPHLSEDQGASASGTPSATTGEEEAHRSDDGEAGDDIRRVTEAIEDAGKALMEHHVYGPGSTSRTRDDDYRTPSDSDGIADDEDDVPMNTAEVPDDDSALLLDTDGRAVTAASQPPYDTSSLEARPELAEGDHIVNNSRSLTPQRYGTPDDHIRPAEQEPSPFDGLGSSYVPPTAALAYNPRTSRRGRSSLLRSSGATSEHDSRETRSPVHGNGSSEEEEEEVEERQVEDGLADDSHAAGLEGSAPSAIARGQQLRNTPRTSPLSSPPPTSSPAVNRERTRLNANVPKVPIRSVNAALGYGDSASHSNASKKRSADKPERPVKRHKGEGPDDSTIVIEISD